MEFTGQLTIFTASEAQWAQDATLLFARLPDLAQKILDARIEFAKSADPSYEDPGATTRFAKTDFLARVRLGEASKRLHEVSLQHGRTAEDETAAFSNLLRDPALSEANAQQEREEAERALAATASIITALETNLEQ